LPLSVLAVILIEVKNPRISLALPLLLALLCAPNLAAQDPALIRRVDDHYNHLRTLRARYTERYTGMGMDRSESGTLTLKKPGLMRWSYDAPHGKLFVLDGKFAWFYTPGDAQVSRAPAKQLDDLRSPLRLLLGHTQLSKELDQLATAPDGASFRITGVPKGMSQRIHLLTLIVAPNGAIQRLKLEETDGASTEFIFTNLEEDIPLPATDFIFIPPAGIPIVASQPPI
jgi:outer membrane lipoprotein carrier protein